jgi:hypothetical protein
MCMPPVKNNDFSIFVLTYSPLVFLINSTHDITSYPGSLTIQFFFNHALPRFLSIFSRCQQVLMYFLIPLPCGTKLQSDLDLGAPVADPEARDGPMLVADCLPEQPSCVMVRTMAVHVDVAVGAVALLHIQHSSPNQ